MADTRYTNVDLVTTFAPVRSLPVRETRSIAPHRQIFLHRTTDARSLPTAPVR
jgi:hypothetical protein